MGMKELYMKYRGCDDPVAEVAKDFHWERDAAEHCWERLKGRYAEMVAKEHAARIADTQSAEKPAEKPVKANDKDVNIVLGDLRGLRLTKELYEQIKDTDDPVEELQKLGGYSSRGNATWAYKKMCARYAEEAETPKQEKPVRKARAEKPVKLGGRLKMSVAKGAVLAFRAEDGGLYIGYEGTEWWVQDMSALDDMVEDLKAAKEAFA